MISWRDIVQTVRFQRLLTALVLLTVESVLRQLKERDAISEAECKRLITQLSTFQNSDITVLQNVFYIEVNPVAKISSVDQAIRLNVFLRTISKLERYNQNPKLHFLIFDLRVVQFVAKKYKNPKQNIKKYKKVHHSQAKYKIAFWWGPEGAKINGFGTWPQPIQLQTEFAWFLIRF